MSGEHGAHAALLETWAIHDRINRYLLDGIPAEALDDRNGGKGRTVGEQLAHVHNVRLMWIKVTDPALMKGLDKVEKESASDAALLRASLERSGAAIATLLEQSFAAGGKIKGFKPHAAAFLGYLVSHESHHRGQVAMTLRAAGHPLDKKVSYGLWEWGSR